MFLSLIGGLLQLPVAGLLAGLVGEAGGTGGEAQPKEGGLAVETPTLAPESLFQIGPLTVTNSMLMTLLVVVLLTLLAVWMTRRMTLVPGRKQNLLETVVELLLGLVEGTAGPRVGRVVLPFIGTLFIYILLANWTALLPGVGTILWSGGGHEKPVPLLRAPNADLNMTLAMAVLTIVIVQVAGVVSNGAGSHFKAYLNPMHLIDELSRILSLSIRLFANVFGGEVLLTVMFALTYVAFWAIIPVLVPVMFLGLELFIGLIQALVFSLLALIYITLSVAGHGHADADTAEQHAESAAH